MKYEIGKQIRKFREARNLSQKELASLLNINNSRVSNWEQGINRPDADMIGEICIALHVSPSELLDIRLFSEEYSTKEKMLIESYRNHPKLQYAIDILLGLDDK